MLVEPIDDKSLMAAALQRQPVRCYPYVNEVVHETRELVGAEQQVWSARERGKEAPGALFWLRLNDRRGSTTAGIFGDVEGARALLRRVRKGSLPGTDLIPDPAEEIAAEVEAEGSLRFRRLPWELLSVLVAEGFEPEEEPSKVVQFWVTPESYRPPEEIPFEARRMTTGDVELVNHHWPIGRDSDASGYISACLDWGFGFVVEVDGEPAGWNLTHLNGSMGFLFVKEEFRGEGVAKSVADAMVNEHFDRRKTAVCDVYNDNEASKGLNLSTGFVLMPWYHTWTRVVPPA